MANSFSELWFDALLACKSEGQWLESRTGFCKEVIGYNASMTFVDAEELRLDTEANKMRKLDYGFVRAFANSIIAGQGVAETRASLREAGASEKALAFLQEPESLGLPANACTLYGPRIAKQMPACIAELQKPMPSRRATIAIFQPNDLCTYGALPDDTVAEVPCTISYSFFLRDASLAMFVSMRSQSLFQVWPIDAYIQARLACHVAELLGLPDDMPKVLHWAMASAHIFEQDFKRMHQA